MTREIPVKTHREQVQLVNQVGMNHTALTGLEAGQYRAPTFDLLIADAPPGFPLSPSNFNEFPFLVKGEAADNNNPAIGPLTPFPQSTP